MISYISFANLTEAQIKEITRQIDRNVFRTTFKITKNGKDKKKNPHSR